MIDITKISDVERRQLKDFLKENRGKREKIQGNRMKELVGLQVHDIYGNRTVPIGRVVIVRRIHEFRSYITAEGDSGYLEENNFTHLSYYPEYGFYSQYPHSSWIIMEEGSKLCRQCVSQCKNIDREECGFFEKREK